MGEQDVVVQKGSYLSTTFGSYLNHKTTWDAIQSQIKKFTTEGAFQQVVQPFHKNNILVKKYKEGSTTVYGQNSCKSYDTNGVTKSK